MRGNTLTDGSKSKNFFTIDDPKGVTEEYSWTWKNGVKGNTYRTQFFKDSDVDYFIYLMKQKYKNILN